MQDSLGNRIKENYENRTRYFLPRRTNTIIRIDGKSFHNFTRKCDRPFDSDLVSLMDHTAKCLCKNIQGAKFAYVQSDEISILLTDYDDIKTDAWFDSNIQKISSISASMATAAFNEKVSRMENIDKFKKNNNISLALFDSRVFTVPEIQEVFNYFIWRQMDATRNSIQMVAQSLYPHKELQGKNTSVLQEMIFLKRINWNDYPVRYKRGGLIIKEFYEKEGAQRSRWVSKDPPIFTQEPEYLRTLVQCVKN